MPKIVDHDRRRHELSMVAASLVAGRGVGALTGPSAHEAVQIGQIFSQCLF